MSTKDTRSPVRFEQLFEQLDDAAVEFVLVDDDPIVRAVNRAFVDVFGYTAEEVVGESLNDFIVPASQQAEAETFDRRTADGESNAAIVNRVTDNGNRTFVYRGVPYADDRGFAIYADITEKTRRERHLDVLQRVLRHNLRNDLNLILGMADTISHTATDSQIEAAATTIKKTATGLSRLSEEAKIVDRVLGEPTTLEPIEFQPIVRGIATEYRSQFDAATITVDIPEAVAVSADQRLRVLLRSLIDNAIVHNDSPKPTVQIRATTTESTVHLEVVDNGPGIPREERAVVTGQTEITPLNHGSGLGLWLVKWITDSYGGQLEIETTDSGSVVRVRLDRARSPSPSSS